MDKPAADLPEMDSGADEEVVEQALEVIRRQKERLLLRCNVDYGLGIRVQQE